MKSAFRMSIAKWLQLGGALMVMASVVWEVVRMSPDYRFIVEPWSIRGHEMTEGWVIFTMGAGLLVLAVLSWFDVPDNRTQLYAVFTAALAWLGAVAIALAADPGPHDLTVNPVGGWVLSFFLAFSVTRFVLNIAGRYYKPLTKPLASPAIWLSLTMIVYFGFVSPNLVGEVTAVEVPIIVAVMLGLPIAIAAVSEPTQLTPNRLLILTGTVAWFITGVMAGPTRSTMLRLQEENMGVAAAYKDSQITWGLMLAFAGMALIFFGAVAGWAKRRDVLIATMRARQQRAAAEESLRELREAELERTAPAG